MNSITSAVMAASNDSKAPTSEPGVVVKTARADQIEWFDAQLRDHHYLGAGRPVGDYLRQIAVGVGAGLLCA
jgi:hypothetical protein